MHRQTFTLLEAPSQLKRACQTPHHHQLSTISSPLIIASVNALSSLCVWSCSQCFNTSSSAQQESRQLSHFSDHNSHILINILFQPAFQWAWCAPSNLAKSICFVQQYLLEKNGHKRVTEMRMMFTTLYSRTVNNQIWIILCFNFIFWCKLFVKDELHINTEQ